MTLSIIVAMTEDRVIGKDNRLPWRLPEDLKRFKKITMGHPIIMGRKTFDSLGRPLPGRTNIVLTRNPGFKHAGVHVARSLEDAVHFAETQEGGDEQFVIGGETIYRVALPLAKRLYLTLIHKKIAGDTYFPEVDLVKDFKITEKIPVSSSASGAPPATFIVAER